MIIQLELEPAKAMWMAATASVQLKLPHRFQLAVKTWVLYDGNCLEHSRIEDVTAEKLLEGRS